MSSIPDRKALLNYSKTELADLCDDLIEVLKQSDPQAVERFFPDKDKDD